MPQDIGVLSNINTTLYFLIALPTPIPHLTYQACDELCLQESLQWPVRSFASVRLGLYDTFKNIYQQLIDGTLHMPCPPPPPFTAKPHMYQIFKTCNTRSGGLHIGTRVAAGITTGALAVLIAQPTDVVKVRFQAQKRTSGVKRYTSTIAAYRMIGREEGLAGLWKGTFPNVSRNAIVNVSEIVCYDIIKDMILSHNLLDDSVPCHFTSAVIAGLCTTVMASPVDVVKTRYMNSTQGEYKGAVDCAVRMLVQEGPAAFYKG
uniref:Mitochondrial uncoupling protein 2 n=1 Tax=Timema cristinae TaxID=61476 RepID=A0A7R9D6C4_TIMCR|nr:unnamed protein product [Timema cristinae]